MVGDREQTDAVAALVALHAIRDAGIEARQIVRDGLRAAGLMPAVLPPRRSPAGHHPARNGARGYFSVVLPGANGEYRMTPGDLPGENGLTR